MPTASPPEFGGQIDPWQYHTNFIVSIFRLLIGLPPSLGHADFELLHLPRRPSDDYAQRQVYGNRSFATPTRDQDSDGQ